MNILETLGKLAAESGFAGFLAAGGWKNLIMIAIACVLLYLGIVKKFEPLLLVGIAFGCLLTNLPGAGLYHLDMWDAYVAGTPYVTAAGEPVPAPMPGTVLRVEVTQGQAVKSGDLLVVLEAMKMENEILAPRDGTVAQLVVSKGSMVDTGAPLVVLA